MNRFFAISGDISMDIGGKPYNAFFDLGKTYDRISCEVLKICCVGGCLMGRDEAFHRGA